MPAATVRLGYWLLVGAGLLGALSATANEHARQMLQAADYVGVDYSEAVQDGRVIDPAEYEEMQEFAAALSEAVAELPVTDGREALAEATGALAAAVAAREPASQIRDISGQISDLLNRWYPVLEVPQRAPSLDLGARLYGNLCASCHGGEGQGDGPAADGLEPAPTNFQDRERAAHRSLFGLYNTIGLGVRGTGMPAFSGLDEHELWSLTFYVASLQPDNPSRAAYAGLARSLGPAGLMTASASALEASHGAAGAAAMAWLRRHPEALLELQAAGGDAESGIALAVRKLEGSRAAWLAGDARRAESLALSAYLDGFETVEAALTNVDKDLMRETEKALAAWRAALRAEDPERIDAAYVSAGELLVRSAAALDAGALSAGVAFTSAFVILTREGLEAILVVAAMLVVVRRAELPPASRAIALRATHGGWIIALLAGAATWAMANWLLVISGSARELTEGVTALLAAGVLLWVGLWMHGQAGAAQWGRFVSQRLGRAMESRSTWLLFGLSFLAVYREAFETVLFYQALWLQVGPAQAPLVLAGIGVALLILGFLAWLILRGGQRLPLGAFFTLCAYTVLALAVVFTGKGVAALQEAGKLPLSPLDVPALELIGVYPSAEGLIAQSMVLALACVWLIRQRRLAVAASRVTTGG